MTIQECLASRVPKLIPIAGVLSGLETRLLLCHVLNCSRTDLIAYPDREVAPTQVDQLDELVDRRKKGEPIAKIIGQKEFWGLPFKVTKDTLDPRPDTETLLEAILSHERPATGRILDLGTGSGCILLSLLHELEGWTGVGIDLSAAALDVARENAVSLGLEGRVGFLQSDWGENVTGVFDVIVSNPPYITTEEFADLVPSVRDFDPPQALIGGVDGLDAYRKISPVIEKHLADDGFFAMEFGIHQEHDVTRILDENNLVVLEIRKDLSGIIRCITGRKRIRE